MLAKPTYECMASFVQVQESCLAEELQKIQVSDLESFGKDHVFASRLLAVTP